MGTEFRFGKMEKFGDWMPNTLNKLDPAKLYSEDGKFTVICFLPQFKYFLI